MKKRFVALLLCLVMVVGLIPAAMAAGPEGDRNYITFKANDGSYGSSSERLQQLTESDVAIGWVTLRANDVNRDGYTFLGWSTEPNGQKIYNDGQTVSVTELFGGRTYAVLYAVWQKDGVTPPVGPYTVTYRQLTEVSLTDPDVVDANVGAPQVAYKETITKAVDQDTKYARQSGGKGQYGHVKIRVEPNESGKGYEFINAVVGGVKIPETAKRKYVSSQTVVY